MSEQVTKALDNVEKHIHGCEILSQLLRDRIKETIIEYDQYIRQGYTREEITTGISLVNLYMTLRDYSSRLKE